MYPITATAQNGNFPNAVTLAASGLPQGATASFSPPSIKPGNGSATSQLSIQTAAPSAQAAIGGNTSWLLAGSMLPLAAMLFLTRKHRRQWITLAILLFASLGAAATLSGCGGGFGLPGSGAKTYSITITGTSGNIQQSTSVQLTVK